MAPARSEELRSILSASTWFIDVLGVVATVDPHQWWVGAGVIRDLVWDTRFRRGFDPDHVKDVDVVFYAPDDLSPEGDQAVELQLRQLDPGVPWQAKNQAAVHLWYPRRFGVEVPAFQSIPQAVATWPEYAACVAVRLDRDRSLIMCAPHGLDDLLDGVWRRNPARATVEEYKRRLARKAPQRRWPGVRVSA